MKFSNLFLYFPLTFSKLNTGEYKNEKNIYDMNSISRALDSGFEVTVQDCDILATEKFNECRETVDTAFQAALRALPDDKLIQVIDIFSNSALTDEETGEQVIEALGEGVLCNAEVEQSFVEVVSCASLCEDEGCDDVRGELRESLQSYGIRVGCDFSLAEECRESSSADYFGRSVLVSVIGVLGIILQGIN
eukprot:snap_masked-scaffold_22-processed-gene-1.14-mRNA-1 protein AED:0.25 eAED:1.00 QI:0/-1/0/1/-1/1/1/0/191